MDTEQTRKLLDELPRRLNSAIENIKIIAKSLEDTLGGMKSAEERLRASATSR
ncbi:MAG: hypothetical protein ACP5HD_07490 [Thermoproteus sp.]